jgi:hypothetical protein
VAKRRGWIGENSRRGMALRRHGWASVENIRLARQNGESGGVTSGVRNHGASRTATKKNEKAGENSRSKRSRRGQRAAAAAANVGGGG